MPERDANQRGHTNTCASATGAPCDCGWQRLSVTSRVILTERDETFDLPPERDANQLAADVRDALPVLVHENLAPEATPWHAALAELVALVGTLQGQVDSFEDHAAALVAECEAAEVALADIQQHDHLQLIEIRDLRAALATTRQAIRDYADDLRRRKMYALADAVGALADTENNTKGE